MNSSPRLESVLPLDAEKIEEQLSLLWRESYGEVDPSVHMHKIALTNLIVFTTPEKRDEVEDIILHFDSRMPSRVLLIVIGNLPEEQSHAHISASCNIADRMSHRLCWEKITIEACDNDIPRLDGLIRSLLTGGEIPVLLVDLYGLKRGIDLRRKIYQLAGFIFVDGRGRFESLLPPPGALSEQYIYGFDWLKIDTMREAVRKYFDCPVNLNSLHDLRKITIAYPAFEGGIPSYILLLAGWLIASLGLEIEANTSSSVRMIAPGGKHVSMDFVPETNYNARELRLSLDVSDSSGEIVLEITDDGSVVTRQPGQPDTRASMTNFGKKEFVFEQSGKDRKRSSYAVSYRAAVNLYNIMKGISGRRSMIVVDNRDRLARVTARLFYSLALRTLALQGRFFVALAGGSTPKAAYQAMVESTYAGAVAWENVYFFFGDERPVGPDNPESNYKLANDNLFKPLGIAPDHVFRIEGERTDYKEVCREYIYKIKGIVPRDRWGNPRFDLVFLGIGEDGHTASLFPELAFNGANGHNGHDGHAHDWLVAHHYIKKIQQHRFTFSLDLLNHAAHIFFVATGENKAAALDLVMFPEKQETMPPAARVNPQQGSVLWLVDSAAASHLEGLQLPLEVSRW